MDTIYNYSRIFRMDGHAIDLDWIDHDYKTLSDQHIGGMEKKVNLCSIWALAPDLTRGFFGKDEETAFFRALAKQPLAA